MMKSSLRINRSISGTKSSNMANAIRGFALLMEKIGNSEMVKLLWIEADQLCKKGNVESEFRSMRKGLH